MHEHIQPQLFEATKIHDKHVLGYIQSEASHGAKHATETANLTFEIAQAPEYKGVFTTPDDFIILRDAAMLHDTGYADTKPYWSGTQEEHPTESAFRAYSVLKDLPFYKEQPSRLNLVLWLIYNHDNTNYTFPAAWLFEQKFLSREAPKIAVPRLLPGTYRDLPEQFTQLTNYPMPEVNHYLDWRISALQVLQEADSRLGDAARTLAFCDSRGVSRFSNEGGVIGVGSLWWQESAAANIILALNRALLDAHTAAGQKIAKQIYSDGFTFLRNVYEESVRHGSIGAERGLLPMAELCEEDIERIFKKTRRERWTNLGTAQTYIEVAHDMAGELYELEERQRVKYRNIATRLVPIDDILVADSMQETYDTEKIFSLSRVREEIIKNYAFDIFTQLVGGLNVKVYEHDPVLGSEVYPYRLTPPVIEIETSHSIECPPYRPLLGANWAKAAREAGLPYLRVLFLEK